MAERDLTNGPLAGHLAAMAVPAAFGMLFTTLYNIVDTFYAGWISTVAQAGLSVSFAGFMLFMAVGGGLSQGAGALIGSALGARRPDKAQAYAAQALTFAALIGVVLGVAGFFAAAPVLRLMGAEADVLAAGDGYLSLLFLSLPAFLLGFTANGVLTAQGDTAANRNAQMAAFFANCGLNPLLIYGAFGVPGLGFDGLAVSTMLTQTGVALWLIRRALGTRALAGATLTHARLTAPVLADILRQGAPSGLTMLVMMVGAAIMQTHLQPFGAAAVAGFGVAFRVEQLILLPILATSFAVMPLVAQNYGAEDAARVRQAMTLTLTVTFGLSLIGSVALGLFGVSLTRIFSGDEAAVASGAAYLRMAALMTPAYAAMFTVTAFFQGLRRPVWSVAIGLYRQVFALALYPWVFVSVLGWGLPGVWAGLFAAVWSGCALSAFLAWKVGRRALGTMTPDAAALDLARAPATESPENER